MNQKTVLLTFDVEEFDLPKEFGVPLSKQQEFEISKEGLINLLHLMDKYNIKSTFFTTTLFAKQYPKLIKEMVKSGHEIASHGYSHGIEHRSFEFWKKAKKEKEKIISKEIAGFRAPRFQIKNIPKLSELGFRYDSSIHPTFIPRRYMNLGKPRNVHKLGEVLEIPLSALPILRLPIFWLAFKNFPKSYRENFLRINFIFSDYLMLLFHPWEFSTEIENLKIPPYIKKNSGNKLIKMLDDYIKFAIKNNCTFNTVSGFLGDGGVRNG